MERNKNIEMFRAVLILYMLVYHYMVSIPQICLPYMIKESFGQFALIGFFVLSGYGTYCYFYSKGDQADYLAYVRRRLLAILPQYWLSLFILLLLTSQVVHLSGKNLIWVLQNILLLQNYNRAGGINGVTWTIAVLFQLYLIAMPLYRLLKKYGAVAWLGVGVCSLVLKRCIFYYIGTHELEPLYYVITSIRLPFTTIDLFITGMFAAYISIKLKDTQWRKKAGSTTLLIICIGMAVLYHIGFNFYAVHTGGLWLNKWTACIWHFLIAIWQGCMLVTLSAATFEYRSLAGRTVQFVARYEYGIYLWHMILLGSFQTFGVSWFTVLSEKAPYCLVFVMVLIAILVGYIFTVIAKGAEYLKFYRFLN